jgi:hypothetical protein
VKTVRLSHLQLSCKKAHRRTAHWNWADDLSHLSNRRLLAWRKTVDRLMEVLDSAESALVAMDSWTLGGRARVFLKTVELGVDRERTLLHRYRRNTFAFRPDWAFRLEREEAFARILRFREDPLAGFLVMKAYSEIMAESLSILAKTSQTDGAQNLLTLLSHFSRDQRLHAQGFLLLVKAELKQRPPLNWAERLWIRGVLTGLKLYARRKGLGDPAKFMAIVDRAIQDALIDCTVLDS